MEVIRELLPGIASGGLIVTADSQSAGRGRIDGRTWRGAPGTSMLATIAIPAREADCLPSGRQTFPLKVGLATLAVLTEAYEKSTPVRGVASNTPSGERRKAGSGEIPPDCSESAPLNLFLLKWPNDILGLAPGDGKPDYRKLCGILCESFSGWLLAGIGINMSQGSYPPELAGAATCVDEVVSATLLPRPAAGTDPTTALNQPPSCPESLAAESLARRIADRIVAELRNPAWKSEYEHYLWAKGRRVSFVAGHPERGTALSGTIEGIDGSGDLVLRRDDGETVCYLAGEIASLRLDGASPGGEHESRTTSVVDR